MLTTEVTGAGSVDATTAATRNEATIGREDFLRMLIAQLENQDPLNPQEATEFTAQLAQFSSLEQLISMRMGIEELASAGSGSEKLAAIGLIGRNVLAEGEQFELTAGEAPPPSLRFELASAADAVALEIRDARGAAVAKRDLGARGAGEHAIAWDARDSFGGELPAGVYSLRVTASSGLNPVTATPLVEARVTGATLSGSNPVLMLGSLVVPLAQVREVRTPDVGAAGAAE